MGVGKMKFNHCWPHLEKSFWLPQEESTIALPLEKILPTPMVVCYRGYGSFQQSKVV